MLLNSNNLQFCVIPNQAIPSEGPKAIPLVLDFSSNPEIEIDGQQITALGRFAMVQTLFIDLSGAANNLIVSINGTGQQIVAKVGTQGYYNVMCPNPFKLKFTSQVGSTDNVPVYLINVPIPGVVWVTA